MRTPLKQICAIFAMSVVLAATVAVFWATCWYIHSIPGDWPFIPGGATLIAAVIICVVAIGAILEPYDNARDKWRRQG